MSAVFCRNSPRSRLQSVSIWLPVRKLRARSTDRRITFQEADAREPPFDHDFFDRAFSMLVLIGGRLRLARVFGAIHRRILRGSLARLTRNVRRTDLVDRPVPRSFVTVTWPGRGTVPSHLSAA